MSSASTDLDGAEADEGRCWQDGLDYEWLSDCTVVFTRLPILSIDLITDREPTLNLISILFVGLDIPLCRGERNRMTYRGSCGFANDQCMIVGRRETVARRA